MLKGILYGAGRFPSLEAPWIFILPALNAAWVWGAYRWIRSRALPAVPIKALPVAAAMWVLFLVPAAMGHGILSRHTTLASLGFSILVVGVLRFLVRPAAFLAAVLSFLLAAGLVINQGISWNQVVACRINGAILETLEERKTDLAEAERVLIDQYSFAERIPYTWIHNPLDQLDTYWGVDALVGKGFSGMVLWVARKRIPVHIARSPLQTDGEVFAYQVYNGDTYRFEQERIPRAKTMLVDYAAVYPRGFESGRR